MSEPARDRVSELLADRALYPLGDDEQRELDVMLDADPTIDPELDELAAAAVHLAALDEIDDRLPENVAARVFETVPTHLLEPAREPLADAALRFERLSEPPPLESSPALRFVTWGGWLAAAAALVVAALSFGPRAVPTAAEARADLLATASDAIVLPWTATDPASPATGDVVWSQARQEGYLRIVGLPANDPRVEQYQLWIFDARRDEALPVEGGVFDIPEGEEEAVIPMDPNIHVFDATLFAVTVEQPGGVMQSSRERLPLLAKTS